MGGAGGARDACGRRGVSTWRRDRLRLVAGRGEIAEMNSRDEWPRYSPRPRVTQLDGPKRKGRRELCGRAVARIMHGLHSPSFPFKEWKVRQPIRMILATLPSSRPHPPHPHTLIPTPTPRRATVCGASTVRATSISSARSPRRCSRPRDGGGGTRRARDGARPPPPRSYCSLFLVAIRSVYPIRTVVPVHMSYR